MDLQLFENLFPDLEHPYSMFIFAPHTGAKGQPEQSRQSPTVNVCLQRSGTGTELAAFLRMFREGGYLSWDDGGVKHVLFWPPARVEIIKDWAVG